MFMGFRKGCLLVTPLLRCNAQTIGRSRALTMHLSVPQRSTRTAQERRGSYVTPQERCHEKGTETLQIARLFLPERRLLVISSTP